MYKRQGLQQEKSELLTFIQNPQVTIEQQRLALRERELEQRKELLETEAKRKGDIEAAKLEAQKGRKADIAAEVKRAQEDVKTSIEKKAKAEDSARTYNVFNIALDNLTKSLGGTSFTGPIAGRIPAATTSAQIADASKAVMLPTLKEIFRSAGEGTFTDSDQRALEALLPRREQTKEAQIATIDAIDQIVRAKLGMEQPAAQQQAESAQQAPQVLRFDAQGNLVQ